MDLDTGRVNKNCIFKVNSLGNNFFNELLIDLIKVIEIKIDFLNGLGYW